MIEYFQEQAPYRNGWRRSGSHYISPSSIS